MCFYAELGGYKFSFPVVSAPTKAADLWSKSRLLLVDIVLQFSGISVY